MDFKPFIITNEDVEKAKKVKNLVYELDEMFKYFRNRKDETDFSLRDIRFVTDEQAESMSDVSNLMKQFSFLLEQYSWNRERVTNAISDIVRGSRNQHKAIFQIGKEAIV